MSSWLKLNKIVGLGILPLAVFSFGCGQQKPTSMSIPNTLTGGSNSIAAKGFYDTSLVTKNVSVTQSQGATFLIDTDTAGNPQITFHSVGDISQTDLSGVMKSSAQVTSNTANGGVVVTFITECSHFGIFPFTNGAAFRLDFAYVNNGNDFDPTQSRIDIRDCGFSQGLPSPAQWSSWGSSQSYVRIGDTLAKR